MKAIIIGFGKMGMLHAATLNALPEVDEILICETHPLIASGIERFRQGRLVIADYRSVLDDDSVQLAVVTTPTHSHGSIFLDLIKHKKHVFIEKPFVTNYQEALQCQEAHREFTGGNSKVMVGYCIRFMPTFELAKTLLDEGVLGRIKTFDGTMRSPDALSPCKSWRFRKAGAGGGVLSDLGSHLIDMTRYLFGMPEKISGRMRRIVSRHVEDWVRAKFVYPEFLGTVEACWSSPEVRKATLEINIVGEDGTLSVIDDEIRIKLERDTPCLKAGHHCFHNTALEKSVPFDIGGPSYTRQIQEWLSAVCTGSPCRNNLAENVDNHLLMHLIRSSEGAYLNTRQTAMAEVC